MRTLEGIDRILLIRRRALGDALVTLPAVREVRAAWPGARIDLVMDRPFAPLLAHLATDVNVLSYPPRDGSSWLRRLRAGNYDLVLDWLSTPQTALWSVLTGARVRVGYALRRRWWAYNVRGPRNRAGTDALRSFAGESFLDPLREMGLAPPPWRDGIAAGAGGGAVDPASTYVRWLPGWIERPGTRVAVVMSATWSAKAWPSGHIAELKRRLRDTVTGAGQSGPSTEDNGLGEDDGHGENRK